MHPGTSERSECHSGYGQIRNWVEAEQRYRCVHLYCLRCRGSLPLSHDLVFPFLFGQLLIYPAFNRLCLQYKLIDVFALIERPETLLTAILERTSAKSAGSLPRIPFTLQSFPAFGSDQRSLSFVRLNSEQNEAFQLSDP